eukprot:766306-Hanusia_phi.AAC.1
MKELLLSLAGRQRLRLVPKQGGDGRRETCYGRSEAVGGIFRASPGAGGPLRRSEPKLNQRQVCSTRPRQTSIAASSSCSSCSSKSHPPLLFLRLLRPLHHHLHLRPPPPPPPPPPQQEQDHLIKVQLLPHRLRCCRRIARLIGLSVSSRCGPIPIPFLVLIFFLLPPAAPLSPSPSLPFTCCPQHLPLLVIQLRKRNFQQEVEANRGDEPIRQDEQEESERWWTTRRQERAKEGPDGQEGTTLTFSSSRMTEWSTESMFSQCSCISCTFRVRISSSQTVLFNSAHPRLLSFSLSSPPRPCPLSSERLIEVEVFLHDSRQHEKQRAVLQHVQQLPLTTPHSLPSGHPPLLPFTPTPPASPPQAPACPSETCPRSSSSFPHLRHLLSSLGVGFLHGVTMRGRACPRRRNLLQEFVPLFPAQPQTSNRRGRRGRCNGGRGESSRVDWAWNDRGTEKGQGERLQDLTRSLCLRSMVSEYSSLFAKPAYEYQMTVRESEQEVRKRDEAMAVEEDGKGRGEGRRDESIRKGREGERGEAKGAK